MLSDETKWKIDLYIKRCSGVCEIGRMLQELYTDYKLKEEEIEEFKKQLRDRRGGDR
jgi:hypothetical protein